MVCVCDFVITKVWGVINLRSKPQNDLIIILRLHYKFKIRTKEWDWSLIIFEALIFKLFLYVFKVQLRLHQKRLRDFKIKLCLNFMFFVYSKFLILFCLFIFLWSEFHVGFEFLGYRIPQYYVVSFNATIPIHVPSICNLNKSTWTLICCFF